MIETQELLKEILKARRDLMKERIKTSDMSLLLPKKHYEAIQDQFSYSMRSDYRFKLADSHRYALVNIKKFPMTKLFGMMVVCLAKNEMPGDFIIRCQT